MHAFETPTVVNPFDRFGEHLRLALHAPASYQLLSWLEAGPGAELPQRGRPPTEGRWVVGGYGRFGRDVTKDLRGAGLEVIVIEPDERVSPEPDLIVGDASEPYVLVRAGLGSAVGSSPAPTTTRPISPCWPPPAACTRSCFSRPGRTGPPAQPCSRRCGSGSPTPELATVLRWPWRGLLGRAAECKPLTCLQAQRVGLDAEARARERFSGYLQTNGGKAGLVRPSQTGRPAAASNYP